ncbi:hypothetical protein EON62_03355 [archaeon]|nr:MAG: hypothetical protein EON62_03355 [archaeon]
MCTPAVAACFRARAAAAAAARHKYHPAAPSPFLAHAVLACARARTCAMKLVRGAYACMAGATCVAAVAPSLMPTNSYMIIMAACLVYIGAHLSLNNLTVEAMTSSDAASLPLVALGGLATLFLLFKYMNAVWVNRVLAGYFVVIGISTLPEVLESLLPRRWLQPLQRRHVTPMLSIPFLGKVQLTAADVLLYAIAAALSLWYGVTKHWVANNILAAAFCISGIQRIAVNSWGMCSAILAALFVYDIVMVFGTPMMVTVATKVDGPIKILCPRGVSDPWGRPAFSLLGLGDIVMPGLLLALLMRFDATAYLRSLRASGSAQEEHTPASLLMTDFFRPLFMSTWVAYVAGLMATVLVMLAWEAAQPALLYLVPAVVITSALTALVLGRASALWHYDDAHYAEQFDTAEEVTPPVAASGEAATGAAARETETAHVKSE